MRFRGYRWYFLQETGLDIGPRDFASPLERKAIVMPVFLSSMAAWQDVWLLQDGALLPEFSLLLSFFMPPQSFHLMIPSRVQREVCFVGQPSKGRVSASSLARSTPRFTPTWAYANACSMKLGFSISPTPISKGVWPAA